MKLNLKHLQALALASLVLTGCIDDKYDLSDIDTTVKVKVDNLVIPVNIDRITLDNVFDLKDDSKIKVIDGQYAFVENGDFDSDPIKIPAIHISSPSINPTKTTVNLPANLPTGSLAGQHFTFNIAGEKTTFTASTGDVSESIVAINRIGCNMTLNINIVLNGLENNIGNVTFTNLVMQLPKGLEIQGAGNKYDPKTGLYNVGTLNGSAKGTGLSFTVTGIDVATAKVNFDYSHHFISFSDDMAISSGTLELNGNDFNVQGNQLPASFTLVTNYTMSAIDVTKFTGRMKYTLDGFAVTDVNLTDLPDVLTQSGTDLSIVNPQIYISLTNPLNIYSLKAQTGLDIKSYRDNNLEGTYSLDAPGVFTIDGTPSVSLYNYYLSPAAVSSLYPGYNGAKHVGYKALSNVLSGDGVPTRLSIDFTSPCIPEQNVTDLMLGTSLGNVKGKYTFFAPLALKGGSTVCYSDVVDGWQSEDLDHVVIESLEVNLTVSTTIPIKLNLTGYPINIKGDQINNVTIEGADINANAKEQKVKIRISGAVTGLDGIRFTARAVAGEDESALSPDMTITLSDIRPVVNGYYQKEL